ncbi:MAG TPA: aldo/keto reductase [Flavisolibacter sp.]|nr:aldo/keto reductase [Flavisolibacter sp.]
MLKRIIPASGEELPVIGLGTWIQFDVGASSAERQPLTEVLTQMAAHGSSLIDSSPMYGRAEAVVGDLTSQMPIGNEFFYATKVWTTGKAHGAQQIQASFYKLRRSVIDLLQIHNLVDWKTHLATLRQLKEEGRIRYIGITHYHRSAHAQLEQVLRAEPIDFVQVNYSIRERHAEASLLATAQERGVAVIINEPFETGALFTAVKGKVLPAWAAAYNINSWSQFFLKYIISHPAVTCVIPGTSNPRNVVDNMGAGVGPLPDEAARRKMVATMGAL